MADNNEHRTYRSGDEIRIVLKLSDESGVKSVRAAFVEKNDSAKQIYFNGDGGGQVSAEVVLRARVTEGTAPGIYRCFSLEMEDGLGNRTVLSYPGIEFRVEDVPGDHEGPKLEGWRLIDP